LEVGSVETGQFISEGASDWRSLPEFTPFFQGFFVVFALNLQIWPVSVLLIECGDLVAWF
jgi:hypothetical protein